MKVKTYNTPGKLLKVENLYQHVKRYCLHSALAELGVVGMKIFKRDPSIAKVWPRTINEWQLAFLVKALILNSNDHRKEVFGDKGLFKSASLYNSLYDKLIETSNKDQNTIKLDRAHSFLIRTANQQFPFQTGVKCLIPRVLYLFDEIPRKIKNSGFNIEKEVRNLYGMTVEEVIIVGFCIFAKADDGYFNPEHLIHTTVKRLRKFLTKENVDKLVSKISADYNTLRDLFREDEGEEGLEHYAFNALRIYPLVCTQIAGLVIPVPRFVIERITNGLFYSLVGKFSRQKANLFLEFFGKQIFEKYVGLLLEAKYKKNELFPEWEYGSRHQRRRTSDWIVIQDDTAILFECKTSGISKEAKSWGELEKVQESLRLRVVGAVNQMTRLINDVGSRKKGLDKLFGIKKFYNIVVTYGRIFLSGTPAIRRLINNELKKIGISNINYHILSIGELEKLMPVLDHFNLQKLLDEKLKDPNWSTFDFDVFLRHFLESRKFEFDLENELLEEKYESLFKQISPRLNLGSRKT